MEYTVSLQLLYFILTFFFQFTVQFDHKNMTTSCYLCISNGDRHLEFRFGCRDITVRRSTRLFFLSMAMTNVTGNDIRTVMSAILKGKVGMRMA